MPFQVFFSGREINEQQTLFARISAQENQDGNKKYICKLIWFPLISIYFGVFSILL